MASVKLNFDRAKARADVDWSKVRATTEADVQRHMVEDGEVPDGNDEPGVYRVSAADVRSRTGLSQAAFAEAVGIPVATWRNWEQGRTRIEPHGVALLALMSKDPKGSLETIRQARAAGLRV